MKTVKLFLLLCLIVLVVVTCKENSTDSAAQTGTLVVETVNSFSAKKIMPVNSALGKMDSVIVMHTMNLKLTLTDIWVSKEVVNVGSPDNLTWYKIGGNTQMKYFNEYKFTAENLPSGEYKSIKINFKNIFYREAAYQSNPSIIINMKERMGLENEIDKWIGSCDDETSLAPTNYFSSNGNHNLKDGKFFVANKNEKVTGFEIKPGKVTKLYWKLGDERDIDPLLNTFEWIDENNNGVWDCGIDRMDNFKVSVDPPLETMWCFVVKYE